MARMVMDSVTLEPIMSLAGMIFGTKQPSLFCTFIERENLCMGLHWFLVTSMMSMSYAESPLEK